jgi:hypothetical protein
VGPSRDLKRWAYSFLLSPVSMVGSTREWVCVVRAVAYSVILGEVLVAKAIIGGQYAVTSTATNISTILSISPGLRLKKLTVKNAGGAANKVYLGDSDVTNVPEHAHAELSADQAYEYWSGECHRINTDDVYIVGTANAANIVFITGIS